MDEFADIVAVMDKAACVLAAKGADLLANRLQAAATMLSTRAADVGVVDEVMVDAALFCTPIDEYGEEMEMPIDAMALGSQQGLPRARRIMKAALAAALGESNG